uniref:Putative secreted protein n=1 Tax=Anopheles darlingi TaxID=43151 RepID=A0A2M4DLF6_ANODA
MMANLGLMVSACGWAGLCCCSASPPTPASPLTNDSAVGSVSFDSHSSRITLLRSPRTPSAACRMLPSISSSSSEGGAFRTRFKCFSTGS